ncbi:hypothetical protein SAMN04488068_1982 [Hydrocarboniphaga daqingensis]|uniref:Uncharacterized protein n=1 Tax=Hydrocarboniphaga daqingensis TaxID=490188 RepID=A0A1M5P236_9GAMM|nr:hypothetical protein [Hydrocarboniphaga daqingensis]SHG95842.1 hypothetical protein SAMN04488068_1982 [Hydrocarboniphaga daqingensis]
MDLSGFVLTVLTSTAISGALAAALVFLSRTWLSERIQQSIRHEYSEKLAHLNAQLRAESEKNVLLLKTSVEAEAERLRFATSTIGHSQRIAIEKRLAALDTLWDGVLATRQNIPTVMTFIDILTVDEYVTMKDHPNFKAMVGELSPEKMAAMFNDNVGSRERIRPYVGEYTWALVTTYQAVILRIAFLVQMGREDTKKLNWHLDSGIQQLLRSALTASDLSAFEATKIGKVGWIQRTFESKVLAAIDIVISGQTFGEEALRQAQNMESKVQDLKRAQSEP